MSYNSSLSVIIIIFCCSTFSTCKAESPNIVESLEEIKKGNTKIYGGTFALQNETLHQVSIRIIKSEESKGFGQGHNCGGTLISPSIVLTAAHCMYITEYSLTPPYLVTREYKKDELVIVMGTLVRTNKTAHTIVRTTEDWTIHPKYDIDDVYNDVAVIKLNESVPLDKPTIKPLTSLSSGEISSGTICSVTGWGVVENKTSPVHLLSVDVPIVSTLRCNASDSYNGTLDEGMICAGNFIDGLIDSCQGDSGGPFVCNKVLYGIVSFGKGCGLPFFPGVYTKVSYFKDWILSESKKLSGTDIATDVPTDVNNDSSMVINNSFVLSAILVVVIRSMI